MFKVRGPPTPDILNEFYRKKFSFSALFRVIDPKTFPHREFGFIVPSQDDKETHFIRNLSFKTPADMRDFMIRRRIVSAHIGGLYNPPPNPKTSITKLKWLGHELIFDLDITDYDDIRTCGKGKDHVCKKCWPLIVNAALIVDETLREDFGFEKITWVFSGRRGFHAWISDPHTLTFDKEVREAIALYISPEIPEEERLPMSYLLRISRIILGKEDLQLLKKRFKYVIERLPRIDKQVTMDLNRLLRIPGSIHPDTGRLVMIVKDLQEFYVEDSPTVWEILGYE